MNSTPQTCPLCCPHPATHILLFLMHRRESPGLDLCSSHEHNLLTHWGFGLFLGKELVNHQTSPFREGLKGDSAPSPAQLRAALHAAPLGGLIEFLLVFSKPGMCFYRKITSTAQLELFTHVLHSSHIPTGAGKIPLAWRNPQG